MIRPLRLADARALTELRVANREFMAPFDPERSEEFFTFAGQESRLRALVAARDQDSAYAYAILDGEVLAGTITLSNVVRAVLQSANVGYWVDRRRNGRGLATAAVAAVAELAFGELGLHRLEAGTLVANVASQRVLEKNAFERIGLARRYLLIAGDWRDHILFQKIPE